MPTDTNIYPHLSTDTHIYPQIPTHSHNQGHHRCSLMGVHGKATFDFYIFQPFASVVVFTIGRSQQQAKYNVHRHFQFIYEGQDGDMGDKTVNSNGAVLNLPIPPTNNVV